MNRRILVVLLLGATGAALGVTSLARPRPGGSVARPAPPRRPVVPDLAARAARGEAGANRAGFALGTLDDPAATPDLVALAAAAGPVLVRANAARALGTHGDAAAAAALAELVAGDAPLRVRQEAALALARIGGPAEVSALTAALRGAADEQLRISIVQALGALDDPAARAALAAHGAAPRSATERAFVARALRDDQGPANE